MKYIHFRHIIHRDLKPSNIIIANDGTIKICDFGVSKLMTSEAHSITGGVGKPKFMAPEIVNEEDYDEKVDVYSFGVLLFFLLNNGDLSKIKIVDIFRGKKIDLPEKFTQFTKNLIYDCLKIESKDRPSFKDILRWMEENDFNFLSLSESELEEVHTLIKQHQAKIPSYET